MSLRIFGVGLGVIVMMLIWIFSIAICIMCIRIRRTVIAITALVIEVFITLIIISWPLAAPTTISEKVEVSIGIPMETVDYIGIPRFILVIVEAINGMIKKTNGMVLANFTPKKTALSAAQNVVYFLIGFLNLHKLVPDNIRIKSLAVMLNDLLVCVPNDTARTKHVDLSGSGTLRCSDCCPSSCPLLPD
ncbi:unnamed protein product [Acanthocheilonema viteae]|uniref:Uncharacterized protein n=1 Tax=Acanthocheilonema viteae TaxID=6277 RepID=A0A498S9X3_ACAVI|nr:unnamed protein product [Acanthocheilonema viteae]